MDNKASNVLPMPPSPLCFNKDEFIKDNFELDKFLSDVRKHSSLDTLREDLSVYMKVLQSSLVELINRDYADFVNLSSNLVGMDKIITNIRDPFVVFREQVEELNGLIIHTKQEVEKKLKERARIRARKATLSHLEGILNCIETMESILSVVDDSNSQSEMLESQQVERVSTEFNQLQFYVSQCRNIPLVDRCRGRINKITQVLQKNLERMFVEGIQANNKDLISRCLRTYVTIDKVCDAEALFAREVVRPYMLKYINDKYLRQQVSTTDMYTKVLEFKSAHCTMLLDIVRPTSGGNSLRGYDFLVNSVWQQVVELMEQNVASIFAAGDPDKFHKEYSSAMTFVRDFESLCDTKESMRRFRGHDSYKHFLSKWSLNIYFQIRFHSIAGSVERAIFTPWTPAAHDAGPPTSFRLALFAAVLDAARDCWSEDVYLRALCHRFWKLTLQIISRYEHWLQDLADNKVKVEIKTETTPKSRLETLKQDGRGSLGSNTGGSGRSSPASGSSRDEPEPVETERQANMEELMTVLVDSFALIEQLRSHLLSGSILSSPDLAPALTASLHASLDEGLERVTQSLATVETRVCAEVINNVGASLKQVWDISRLYRRTNKEIPTKPSQYIRTTIEALQSFQRQHAADLPNSVSQRLLSHVTDAVTKQYEEAACEVLVSVKKMEESLKRLKRGKAAASGSGVSDDDKIRIQISVDVTEYQQQLSDLGVDIEENESYKRLLDAVNQSLPSQQEPAST